MTDDSSQMESVRRYLQAQQDLACVDADIGNMAQDMGGLALRLKDDLDDISFYDHKNKNPEVWEIGTRNHRFKFTSIDMNNLVCLLGRRTELIREVSRLRSCLERMGLSTLIGD
ncbi:MAG: PQQ-dependent sugar dehydrogenase [Caldilineaceae bacterium SB0662_bin_9]|uniref:PQQ-dependent sugar dehydrogenase n=1 Tax=Caldilineaceae bacterium SB0662_bin_9 TaxID=2605258 RepID=A0A6B1DWK2_9CHLR|nr:PQQ-dependent sugar dehydrogenase [Caldilineaceae bacterium SB0662_bin_9]